MTAAGQPLVGTTIASQPLGGTMATVRLIDLVLVEMVWSTLRSQENCLSQENRKAKKRQSLEIWLSQEKSCQKVGIHLISILWRPDRNF